MTAITVTIEGPTRGLLAAALLGVLSEHADLLAGALSTPDRDSDAAPVREAYRQLRAVAELLERLQWRTDATAKLTLDAERELPVALAALRNELQCVEEITADSRERGSGNELASVAARLDATRRALLELEATARRAQSRSRDALR